MADGHSPSLDTLQQQLAAAHTHDQSVRHHNQQGQPVHVPGAGKTISSAYEQLRNAAEYAEEHLVLQRAIRRFYNRTLFVGKAQSKDVGHELIVELVQAGYLQAGAYSTTTEEMISQLAKEYLQIHGRLRQAHVPNNKALDWVLSVMSVKTENLLSPHSYHTVLASFAYQHFLQVLPRDAFIKNIDDKKNYEISLFVAVHQALLKSDIDVVRTEILTLYNTTADDVHNYVVWNDQILKIYLGELTQRLKRAVSKNGAPLRILKGLIEDTPDLPQILPHKAQFMQLYDHQISKEYARTERRLNTGIVKSIIFIFITKVLIGIGIEVPYDLIVYGAVAWLPLTVNLLFPPIYMASIRLGLSMPSAANAAATKHYIDELLYGDGQPDVNINERRKPYSLGAKLFFTLLFFVPVAIIILILQSLQFNWLQMVIFFVFFSTASFLGFRLRSMVRELKMNNRGGGMLSLLVDFFYRRWVCT